jgi:uncharacterized FlaG/YvyC family protein
MEAAHRCCYFACNAKVRPLCPFTSTSYIVNHYQKFYKMKKAFVTAGLAITTFLIGCGSDDNNPTPQPTGNVFKIEVTGTYGLDGCSITNNTSTKISADFFQNSYIIETQNRESTTVTTSTFTKENLQGNTIGVNIRLTDYDHNNLKLSLGDKFENLRLKIVNTTTNEIVINTGFTQGWLISCTDIIYQINATFNTTTNEVSFQVFDDANPNTEPKQYELLYMGQDNANQQLPFELIFYTDDIQGNLQSETVNSVSNTDVYGKKTLQSFDKIGFKFIENENSDIEIWSIYITNLQSNQEILHLDLEYGVNTLLSNQTFMYDISDETYTIE